MEFKDELISQECDNSKQIFKGKSPCRSIQKGITLGKKTIISRGCYNNPRVRYQKLVKIYTKTPDLGDQVDDVSARRLRDNTGKAQEKKEQKKELQEEKIRREWCDERH